MAKIANLLIVPVCYLLGGCASVMEEERSPEQTVFDFALNVDWQEVFRDEGTGDWRNQWILDGEIGTVTNSDAGMRLLAGPERGVDAHHMVLWTRDSFEGNLKIDYEYTRIDNATNFVNILYIQATGTGKEPFATDIMEWRNLRKIPAMRMYFDHMHLYHISYAAFPNDGDTTSYVRARRYMPNGKGLKGTELEPDYFPEGLFKKGVPHQITVIKQDRDLFMKVINAEQTAYFHFKNPDLPIIRKGRIGLRQMYTRSAIYKNFRVSIPASE